MLVSYYHFYRMNKLLGNYAGNWDDFFELFRLKKLAFGDWFDFMTDWWEGRKDMYLLHVQYEDLLRDPVEKIKEMAASAFDEIVEIRRHLHQYPELSY